MTNNKNQILPLRIGVGIILLNKENKVFVGKRIDNPNNYWQMPQGGVDKNEDLYEAALRELEEETSIKSVQLIKKINDWQVYELPDYLIGKIWKGKYRGQKQKWFVMRFVGIDDEIKINTKNAEFLEWKWIESSKLTTVVVEFKKKVYQKILVNLKEILN